MMCFLNINICILFRERSNVEVMILENMEVRRIDKEKELEERQRNAVLEKEERENKAKMEKEERELKERSEKYEKESRDLMIYTMMGMEKKKRKQIKIQAVPQEDTDSQPLPVKINLTDLSQLLK